MDFHRSRRSFLRRGLAVGTVGLAGCGGRGPDTPPTTGDGTTDAPGGRDGADHVTVEPVTGGLAAPLDLDQPAVEDRLFVADQAGVVYAVAGGTIEPFLDLTDRIVDLGGYEERGLLGLAFHPAYAENGRFFVRYSAPRREGTPDGYSHTFVLAEFRAEPGGDVESGSERTILEIREPQSNHNGGDLAFGPDGYLYVSVGDGGGANDVGRGHVADWYGENAGGNGQDVTENLLGSVLRIDVDGRGSGEAYAIPDGNPLVGREGLDEHYAWGFRNPWRLSFGPEGRLFVADVGQNRFEEVNIVEKGGNYGWNVREGFHCFSTETPSNPPSSCPTETAAGAPLLDPILEYPHSGEGPSGIAVIGGYFYGRDDVPAIADAYVFADWRARGRLFVARPRGSGDGTDGGSRDRWSITEVPVRTTAGSLGRYVLGFGRDAAGALYVLTTNSSSPSGESGAVWRIVG